MDVASAVVSSELDLNIMIIFHFVDSSRLVSGELPAASSCQWNSRFVSWPRPLLAGRRLEGAAEAHLHALYCLHAPTLSSSSPNHLLLSFAPPSLTAQPATEQRFNPQRSLPHHPSGCPSPPTSLSSPPTAQPPTRTLLFSLAPLPITPEPLRCRPLLLAAAWRGPYGDAPRPTSLGARTP
eukprot:1714748-Rhodomonas_salina.2